MPENEMLCHRLLERLEFLHPHVLPFAPANPLKRTYNKVVVHFVKMMRQRPLLSRLANSETLVQTIEGFQLKLDDVMVGGGLDASPMMTQWREQWDSDRAQQYPILNDRVPRASERMLVNEIRGDSRLQEALMTLWNGMNWGGLSPEMRQLKTQTFDRVSVYASQAGLQMFDWFIPIDNVEYGDETIGNVGTFGAVSRGTWTHGGIRTPVVVKQLFPELSNDPGQRFLLQLQLWSSIPGDRHILKLHGGSHVSTPQFYVCEDAHLGNLTDFLAVNSTLFWRMFYQVAEGLQVLHNRNIVHGGLKCNNILVGEGFTAKLSDFGFSTVRSLSAALSAEAAQATSDGIRWRPKEVLEETGNEEPQFASDIYSMGMCMIEVLTGGVPFGVEDDQIVMEKIMAGILPDRPEGTFVSCTTLWTIIKFVKKSISAGNLNGE
ncbi:hypothetical protein BBO99_00003652 [Phytophthora kernoviae]|uniref:Protein kinase domain-containing protein n=2 Tax=Phytophthora kernoviae TaxID=325452 RepID=A0A3R7G7U7_9STRA|nr:hypothetical protein G195_004149 [Phytophthora kernoviae 00238/432]RLN44600.1 hypothetical protein BBI17_003679 [Phytophthora kernoviae]RLN81518.1 hypothetical protein BBO99_00003652 [Phytophthora kernoviae]